MCEEGTEWREKDRHLPASSFLSYPYNSRLTTHTLDSLTHILIYNMAEQPHTDSSGKSTKPSILSRITRKLSQSDRFWKSTQNPDSVTAGASTNQSEVSAYLNVQKIIAEGKKEMPARRSRSRTANSQVEDTGTQGTATRA